MVCEVLVIGVLVGVLAAVLRVALGVAVLGVALVGVAVWFFRWGAVLAARHFGRGAAWHLH